MTLSEFAEEVLKNNPKANIALIKKAYILAETAHAGQKRESGERYFSHPLEVARILVNMKADTSTICAALLHDVVEDTSVSLEKVKEIFGEEIAYLVEGVTKVDKMQFKSREEYTSENIRKIILATARDIRVMLIKLADRLHNMQTLKDVSADRQKRTAQETLDIYAPIAHKLGMWRIKGELEDLSLRYLEPEIYKKLAAKIAEKRDEREKRTDEIINTILHNLKEKGVKADVSGRAKYFYSIYKKMLKKHVDFNEIYDLIAIRIITKNIPDCYAALGVVHDLWKPLPHRFKDYIAVPKANGYQSLHTTVVGGHGKILEVQIRTEEMHNISEDGIAAHWLYHGTERDQKFDKKISWLKQILEWKRETANAQDFVESLKVELFEDEIVVFTPKGDPISLPVGSTPVDFAYEVHTNIGHHCSKAMVNNTIVPLDKKLESGDVVEIITTKNATPSRQWLKFVKTSKAKSKIKGILHMAIERNPKAERIAAEKKAEEDEGVEESLASYLKVKGKKAPLKISKCCSPQKGEKIEAFYTKDGKITIHKEKCPNIHSLENAKKADVSWSLDKLKNYQLMRITVTDEVGLLVKILNIISTHKINIISVNTKQTSKEHITIFIKLSTHDNSLLKDLSTEIKKLKSIVNLEIDEK